jgi:hypothetical protein
MKHTRRVAVLDHSGISSGTLPSCLSADWDDQAGQQRDGQSPDGNLPNFSQYGDSSHPARRMGAVRGASELALHLWAILGSNQ